MATSYANTGGTGDRSASITVTTNTTVPTYNPQNLVNGSTTADSSNSWSFNGSFTSGYSLVFDFWPSGFKQTIDECKWIQSTTNSHGTWVIEGFDGGAWVEVKSSFTLGGATTQTITFDGTVAAYYCYRFRQTGGSTSSTPFLEEVEFKIEAGAAVSSVSTDYANAGGTGDRTASVTATTTFTLGAGTAPKYIDGSSANDFWWTSQTAPHGFKFDFGVGASKVINEVKHSQSNNTSHGWWSLSGSNDDAAYIDIGGFIGPTFGSGSTTPTAYSAPQSNQTGFRYYKFTHVDQGRASQSSPFIWELDFKIGDAVVASFGDGAGTANGQATVAGVGDSLADAAGAADGQASVSGVSSVLFDAAGTANGQASVSGVAEVPTSRQPVLIIVCG